ncbi:MAG: methyltransferase domain-containing protein [Firmicutes bacterium]|nr:methyltransferase domain-containing protein [Bacillota bacterium]
MRPGARGQVSQKQRATFDVWGERYQQAVDQSIAFSHQSSDFFAEVKAELLLQMMQERLGDTRRLHVLDVGCGVGRIEHFLAPACKSVHAVDVSPTMIDKARESGCPAIFACYDGRHLPYANGSFDCTFAICVLHHVAPSGWTMFLEEMRRVTRKGGMVVIFEHNPRNPLTRLAVDRCPFDKDAVLLAQRQLVRFFAQLGLKEIERRYILFFPWRASIFRRLETHLAWLPLGAQYCVAGRP